jgi:biopolymer transport protein ExbD
MRLTTRSAKHSSKLDLPLTSMIDVVFLLLIYFLVTSSLVKEERELDAGIQVRRASAAASNLAPTIVRIVPGASGFVYKIGGRELTSQTELTRLLAQLENKTEMAYVSPDDDAPYDMAAAAIQALKDARFLNVTYAPPEATR